MMVPKIFESAPQKESKYKEYVHRIGREMLCVFFHGLKLVRIKFDDKGSWCVA